MGSAVAAKSLTPKTVEHWHLDRVLAAIRTAVQDTENPEVADALAAAFGRQHGRQRLVARKRKQDEDEVARQRAEEAVVTALEVELKALRGTDPGMTLLTAVEFVTSHPGHRFALYRLCSVEARDIRFNGMSQDDSQGLKIASLVANDLAPLERRAKAEGFQVRLKGGMKQGSRLLNGPGRV